jgi:hypothetical protein
MMHCKSSSSIITHVVIVIVIILGRHGKSHDLVERINDSLIGILIPIRDGIIINVPVAPAAPAIIARIGITTILVIPTTPCLISTAIGATGVGGGAGAPFGLTTREAVGQFVALGVGGGGHGENG